jgi:uncharacterized protein YbjQ (UPF0145 family)
MDGPETLLTKQSTAIYLCIDGCSSGPFVLEELRALWGAGDLPGNAAYRHEGLDGWRSVSEFREPPTLRRIDPKSIVLTTGFQIANREVECELEIVTAESVFGLNIIQNLIVELRDGFGGRSAATQKELRKARIACLSELRKEAVDLGANAVIGVDLDYSEFSGHGKGMLFLVATGTAVRLKPILPPIPAQ